MNKQVETANLYEESVVAKRTICDYVSYAGGIQNVDVTNKKLILAATAARQKYSAYLSELHTKELSQRCKVKEEKSLIGGAGTAENQETQTTERCRGYGERSR